MVDLPQRFVPTSSKFINPARIVPQSGHGGSIEAVRFSPDMSYFAAADAEGCVKIWAVETLDVLGSYPVGKTCTGLDWEGTRAVICRFRSGERKLIVSNRAGEPEDKTDGTTQNFIHLIGTPELESDSDHMRISYDGDVFEHDIPNLIQAKLDPFERYAVGCNADRITIVSALEDKLIAAFDAPDGRHWRDFILSAHGETITAICDDASVCHIDPIKKSKVCVPTGRHCLTAWDFGGDSAILLGTATGNIIVYDIAGRAVMMRTPRKPLGFIAAYPSPEKTGFAALRPESATAFFGVSHEILSSAPLPAPVSASCAGTQTSELIAACTDANLYRLKLDDNAITRIGTAPVPVDAIAANEKAILTHDINGRMTIRTADKTIPLDWTTAAPCALAVSANGQTLAALLDDAVEITTYRQNGGTATRRISAKNAAAIAFGKDKTAHSLFIFMDDLRINALNLKTDELTELTRIPIENARLISLAPAAKSYVYALLAVENDQMMTVKIGLNSGKICEDLRIIVNGRHIWAASTSEETVLLRRDADCLRIVTDLKSYSIDDWSRCEPLEIS